MTTQSNDTLLVSIEEAGRLLCLGRTTIYALIATGELKSRVIRRRRMIPRSALEAFIKKDHPTPRVDSVPVTHYVGTNESE